MSADALNALADELDVVATWFSGPRNAHVLRLSEQARALAAGQQVDVRQVALSKATTAAPPASEPAPEDEPH